ncbi:methyltransferase [Urechidicola sp. KH5]
MKPFQFKQFTIHQDQCAMKVGTDGVLLGAWAQPKDIFSILDIGTGSGLIALQMAQKSFAEVIDAVELNEGAYVQAVENFEQSDWGDRLFCYHASFQEFVAEMEGEEYDFIVSNPPFYTNTVKEGSMVASRQQARHEKSLPAEILLGGTAKLLSEHGSCAFIIPFQEEVKFLEVAQKFSLFPNRITRVKGKKSAPVKRTLLQLSFENKLIQEDELIIELERHVYTKEYTELVKDFYLKM